MKIVPLTSLGFAAQESVKVKILDNQGLDIVRDGDSFITDVALTPDLQQYCASVPPAQFQQLAHVRRRCDSRQPFTYVDYSSECYWALTSRLRGYHVNFLYIHELDSHPFSVRAINKNVLKMLCKWCENGDYYGDEEDEEDEWESIYDSAVEEAEDNEEEEESWGIDGRPRHQRWRSPSHDSLLNEDSTDSDTASEDSYYGRRRSHPIIKAIRPITLNNSHSAILVVEYNEGCDFISQHNVKQVGKTAVIELFDPDGACSCMVVSAGSIHASAWDLELHSDEGAYDSGVNIYSRDDRHQGIILMGEQNVMNTYNYANSLYHNIIVPDLAE